MIGKKQNPKLPYDLIEEILVRLPVKSFLRFNSVSKFWRSTIKSRFFGERHCSWKQSQGQSELVFIYAVKPDTGWLQLILSPAMLQLLIDDEKDAVLHRLQITVVVVYYCHVRSFWFRADTWSYVAYKSGSKIIGIPWAMRIGNFFWLTQM